MVASLVSSVTALSLLYFLLALYPTGTHHVMSMLCERARTPARPRRPDPDDSVSWQAVMDKWFSDIGVDVERAGSDCNQMLPTFWSRRMTGEYHEHLALFQRAVESTSRFRNLEGHSGELDAQVWVSKPYTCIWDFGGVYTASIYFICSQYIVKYR